MTGSNHKPTNPIQMSIDNWNHQQRLAIARVSGQALSLVDPIVHRSWGMTWWDLLLDHLDLSQLETESTPYAFEDALSLLSRQDSDIRIDILTDLLAIALQLDKVDYEKSGIIYDARSRCFFFALTRLLGLDTGDMCAVERSIGQQMYFALQEASKADSDSDRVAGMGRQAQKAMDETNNKKKAFRWLATGAGIIGGGAVIALTGGLAAPLVAPLVAGLTGATFFATAGGVALITSLFGLTGGGLAGWKMHRRTRGLEEFEFVQILNDSDLPPIPALSCTICITGFLAESKEEVEAPWADAFSRKGINSDIYCLSYETEALLTLGHSFRRFVTSQAAKYAGVEVAKQTVLRAVFAAVALPATLLSIADVIDNPWQIASDRSRKAGLILADVLQERVQGNRPCNLIGYSCGTIVIWHCLKELFDRGCEGIVDNVVLMGAPISCHEQQTWNEIVSTVSGRFVNCYTSKDWVLAFVYRLHSLDTSVAGLEPVQINRIENIELDLDGHLGYTDAVEDILCNLVKIV
ncbi:hypothetical protein J3Q64DRAFT_1705489 [Phycomyces blakesleeanus]|uniref:DUF726-domain-containing protein n=2 Tax=Phycomyces blakesleeanus TaxID=4837 RepID=A0A167PID7_PHYB8|nr:hypothetical protein PHYBLDRAFT_185704 [Phycomyces blakesleeanus NRRL 1555(-)]OAD77988.1 hypothetical protein PHYBLDRAFT_185704 [Phycomyces blakesleeanus NRRL 1555(-)]|eukprot:XP_018296028.1 hypothetical protein PHYBLDRAFT_185704 [Phycomyces blakesleeanus NRRL 1555(-)]